MTLIADMLLIAGSLGAAIYCLTLSRRLRRLNDMENGMGGAIAALSAKVDEMTKALEVARDSARNSTSSLDGLTGRAEDAAQRLELLVASLHDVPLGGDQTADRDGAHARDGLSPGDGADGAAAPSAPTRAGADRADSTAPAEPRERDEMRVPFIRSSRGSAPRADGAAHERVQ